MKSVTDSLQTGHRNTLRSPDRCAPGQLGHSPYLKATYGIFYVFFCIVCCLLLCPALSRQALQPRGLCGGPMLVLS